VDGWFTSLPRPDRRRGHLLPERQALSAELMLAAAESLDRDRASR
jgi:hypothetical protein